jgi:hypothetical protein
MGPIKKLNYTSSHLNLKHTFNLFFNVFGSATNCVFEKF